MAKNRNKAAVNAPKPRAFGLVVVAALLALGTLVYSLNRKSPSPPAMRACHADLAKVAVTARDHVAHQCDRERVSSATSVH